MRHLAALLFFVLILISCDSVKNYDPPREFQDIEKDLQTKFILAENNSVIELETGDFIFNKSLILEGKENVTIRGKGIFNTILSFKNQKDGAEGIRIANCKNITLENFSIEDAAGDNIKVTDTDGITIRKIKSAWTGVVNEKNGAYGLYPVLCRNVLVEECEVLGASDAGIYVGQSHDVIIRKNKVYWNVAGIESENSVNVKIYGNRTYENTGGILVFDLPGLTMTGENIEVYSIVGEYLEHSRIYYFHNKGEPKIYGGSADVMVRSFDRRIESLFLVKDAFIQKEIMTILSYNLKDNVNSYVMNEDGTYSVKTSIGDPPFNIFKEFYNLKKEELENINLF